jgi:hypothetical protein
MKKSKEGKPLKHIKAHTITLVDARGEPRIMMDATDKDGGAFIILTGKDGQRITISSDADGMIGIHVDGRELVGGRVNIIVTKDDEAGISIMDKSGRLGIILAEEPGTATHRLLLFQNGRHFWNTPSGKKPPQKNESPGAEQTM